MKNNNLNIYQQNYINAKSLHDITDIKSRKRQDQECINFLKSQNAKNLNGKFPKKFEEIDDVISKMYNMELEEICDKVVKETRINEYYQLLKNAENDLIEYSLSIMPPKMQEEKEALLKAAKTSYKHRDMLINLAMKTDYKKVLKGKLILEVNKT